MGSQRRVGCSCITAQRVEWRHVGWLLQHAAHPFGSLPPQPPLLLPYSLKSTAARVSSLVPSHSPPGLSARPALQASIAMPWAASHG